MTRRRAWPRRRAHGGGSDQDQADREGARRGSLSCHSDGAGQGPASSYACRSSPTS